jgi:hypothetical protein
MYTKYFTYDNMSSEFLFTFYTVYIIINIDYRNKMLHISSDLNI